MIPALTLLTVLLLSPLAELHSADAPVPEPTTGGGYVPIPPACTDITHDSPNPAVTTMCPRVGTSTSEFPFRHSWRAQGAESQPRTS